ncbi:MAG TPA: N-acetylglucosamine-6-phosphate deacetylase [Pyrinomonadaceae bacterium]|nr:N-acetylglucosamine-6-phosphate deacetylase [Pyrinomonadaceae bacterium]
MTIRLPGFIDIHNHGAVGVDVNSASADDLVRVSRFLATHGVAGWLPTLVPDSDDVYKRVVEAIDEACAGNSGVPQARILGVHYEGIFANAQMCGALRPEFFKKFTGRELEELPVPESGAKMMTLAPEVEGGIELIRELAKRGWIASIGHTHADVATLKAAIDAGAKHLTHFFNAMSGIHHRELGVAGWGLTEREVSFDVIADGRHVAPEMVTFACRTKGVDRVSLISDSVAPTGLGDGTYDLWGERIAVLNGVTRNERGSIAGSVITMLDAVRNMLRWGFSADEIAKMTSRNPARLIGAELLQDDLVELDENFELREVRIGSARVS